MVQKKGLVPLSNSHDIFRGKPQAITDCFSKFPEAVSGPGKCCPGRRQLRLAYAEYVMGEHPAALLFREGGQGGVQSLDLFFLLIEFSGRGGKVQGAMLDAVPRFREYCAL